jgi:hypothetical protein
LVSDLESPRLLIATRLGLGIRDPAWFDHRLAVMSAVTAPSLAAQDDQEFEWAIFVSPDLPKGARHTLDELIAPFDGRAFVDSNGHSAKNLLSLAADRGLVSSSGYVLTGRIDDDDAWVRHTVSTVRARTASWLNRQRSAPGFGLTFENGLVWVMYDMLDIEQLQLKGDEAIRPASVRAFRYPFTSISGFVLSPLSHGMTPLGGSHSAVPRYLGEQGFEVEVVSTEEPMWLYCRHKQTTSAVERAADDDALEIGLSDLTRTFGIDEARVRSYIAKAGEYGYSRSKRLFERRGELRVAFRETKERIADPDVSASELANLRQKASRLEDEHARLGENLVIAPENGAGPAGFCHVIQTRFSVRASSGFQEFPPDWLEERLKLFDAYCLPSVAAQTCKDFLWQVYCDKGTDAAILQELHERAEDLPQMRIALTGPGGRSPAAHVIEEMRFGHQALLTTRLDSDAAISECYVEAVQAHVQGFVDGDDATLLLNFPRGHKLETDTGRLLSEWTPCGNFHTLFERHDSEAKTVLSGDRSTFHEEHRTEQDDSISAWLTVMYGER